MSSDDSRSGVYVQELSTDARTITGAATSVAALAGRTLRGPVGRPVAVSTYGEFDQLFGGLAADFPLAYAVWDFFQNGGSRAVVVRLYPGDADAGTATLRLSPPGTPALLLRAADPGDWASGAVTAHVTRAPGSEVFALEVRWTRPDGSVLRETFTDVSVQADAGPRRLDRVLAAGSVLLRLSWPDSPPPEPEDGWTGVAAGGVRSAYLGDADYLPEQGPAARRGVYALEDGDGFNLLCLPPDRRLAATGGGGAPQVPSPAAYSRAAAYCLARRAFLLVDPPAAWSELTRQGQADRIQVTDLGSFGTEGRNAAVYFPCLLQADPRQGGTVLPFAPSGAVAGVIARTDAAAGLWKAPAGVSNGVLSGVVGLSANLGDGDNGVLNPQGINCLRDFPVYGPVVWGARTLRGADALQDDYKYIPVRRLALYIEESIVRGTGWTVFEPNAEPLWAALRQSVGAFLRGLAMQGAFPGSAPDQGWFVRCDATTTTPDDVAQGRVNVLVGFAPVKPAEFIVLTLPLQAALP